MWACRGGQLGHAGGDGARQNVAESESDVSATSLEETVRIPLEQWPDSLLVTVAGIRKEALAVDLLAKVRHLGFLRGFMSLVEPAVGGVCAASHRRARRLACARLRLFPGAMESRFGSSVWNLGRT